MVFEPLRDGAVSIRLCRFNPLRALRQSGRFAHKFQRTIPVEVLIDCCRLCIGRALRKKLKCKSMACIVRIEQVACVGKQFAAVVCIPLIAERVELVEPRACFLVLKVRIVWRQSDLTSAELPHGVHHFVQLAGSQDASGVEQRLVGHHEPTWAAFGQGHCSREVRVDSLAIAR